MRWTNNALVSGEYFAVMGIPLRQGRTFSAIDAPIARMSDIVARSLGTRQFALVMLLAFAALALGLAVPGLYSVLFHAVAQRAAELGSGWRGALLPRGCFEWSSTTGLRLTGVGLAIGGVLGGASPARCQASCSESARSAPFGAAVGQLFSVGLLASFMPARRAARVDPMLVAARRVSAFYAGAPGRSLTM